ncbi:hypothetical protein PR048_005701 [Dryococelus australis]|uniref:DDE-1 domain-containing protein n=1 Tax=Dryococelus australis TaxID=614101 RepID=A0ABQ9I8Y8_9NEOP|nr:hypothetical protein PR048_005701 [Dryococelus australis]
MTDDLVTKWLKASNARVRTRNRKVALLIENCPAHPTVELRNTELVFLPPNTTSVLQPMEQGISQLVKKKFRDMLVHDMFVVYIPEQITEKVVDNPDCLPAEDDKVTAELGDKAASSQPGTPVEPQPGTSHDVLPCPALPISKEVWDRISPGVEYEDYLTIDEDTPAWGASDNEDLISGHKESTDEEWEGEEDAVPKRTREGMPDAIEMLTNGMLHSYADSEGWTSLEHLKKWVVTSYETALTCPLQSEAFVVSGQWKQTQWHVRHQSSRSRRCRTVDGDRSTPVSVLQCQANTVEKAIQYVMAMQTRCQSSHAVVTLHDPVSLFIAVYDPVLYLRATIFGLQQWVIEGRRVTQRTMGALPFVTKQSLSASVVFEMWANEVIGSLGAPLREGVFHPWIGAIEKGLDYRMVPLGYLGWWLKDRLGMARLEL